MIAMSTAGTSSSAVGSGSPFAGSSSRFEGSGFQLHDGPAPNLNDHDANGATGIDDGKSTGKEAASAKKANPLADLIETEVAYVSELGKIIKKVAGAWSRTNFPPAELDTMFRNVEAIYRMNRTFLKSLKEIGPNPSSPRALGDLLMRWIDDMEAPYQRYCDNYFTDFDSWTKVQSNPKLPALLESVSETAQPDGSPVVYSDRKRKQGQVWTLDQLFSLPQARLKYYKKLYARLLKSTQEGRSDHRLLVSANEKLDDLLQRSKTRIAMSILDEGPIPGEQRQSAGSSLGGDTTGNTIDSGIQQRASSSTSLSGPDINTRSTTPIVRGEETKGQPSFSAVVYPQGGAPPSPVAVFPPSSPKTVSPPRSASSSHGLTEGLEARLDTSRTLDIFSMKPKKCQLRINPPGIPFKRELRKAADVVIYFTPTSTGQEIVLRRAHLFLLTDLFLICERMTPGERASRNGDPAEMWLLYPPLAGKHLRVQDVPGHANAFTLVVLKKERLLVHTDSQAAKEDWVQQLTQCQQFGSNLGLKVKTDTSSSPVANGQNGSLSSPAALTPGLSPAISVTPSSRDQNGSASGEDDIIKDVTELLDGSRVFSPHASLGSDGLGRGNSFNSFIAPLKDRSPDQMALPPVSSPPMSALSRSSDTGLVSSPPPLMVSSPAMMPGMISSPPERQQQLLSTPPNALTPQPMINGRPPMGQGRPPFMSSPRNSPPQIPAVPPPNHLLNNGAGWNGGRPGPGPGPGGFPGRPGPPPSPNSMGRPLPPRPPQMGPGGPMGMNGRPSPRPGMPGFPPMGRPGPLGMQQRPPSRDVSRRPSAPDLRDNSSQPIRRQSSEGLSGPSRTKSTSSTASGPPRLPSDFLKQAGPRQNEQYSPPSSPTKPRGPKTSTVAAQMRCRLYLKQSHGQWKALGNARLKLYHLMPDDVKQLVVENDKKPTPLISSIILADGVERVGKVGVAVELSDNGSRTGIIYMLHLRSEESAFALFGQLLEGSDRSVMVPDA